MSTTKAVTFPAQYDNARLPLLIYGFYTFTAGLALLTIPATTLALMDPPMQVASSLTGLVRFLKQISQVSFADTRRVLPLVSLFPNHLKQRAIYSKMRYPPA